MVSGLPTERSTLDKGTCLSIAIYMDYAKVGDYGSEAALCQMTWDTVVNCKSYVHEIVGVTMAKTFGK